jgi:hypothetical protein
VRVDEIPIAETGGDESEGITVDQPTRLRSLQLVVNGAGFRQETCGRERVTERALNLSASSGAIGRGPQFNEGVRVAT